MPEDDPPSYPWYAVVSGESLEQGDILLDCPVPHIPANVLLQPGACQIRIDYQNVIVMTQSCDLAIRGDGRCNADDVILAALYSQEELKDDKHFGELHNWENARKGRLPRYHVLNKCELDGHCLDFMLVDLGKVFSLSIDTVRAFAKSKPTRLRLLPPYREHLSQAFARFFMRVGLPIDVPPFKQPRK